MPTFPFIQSPVLVDYKEYTQPAIIRTETEGIIKQSVRYAANYINYNVSYMLTSSELAQWRDFFTNTIERGAVSFDWVEPSTGATVDARIVEGAWDLTILAKDVNTITFSLEVFTNA